jgi:hypothetical protein
MKAAGQLYNTAKGRQGRSSGFTIQVCSRDTCELQIPYSKGTPRFDESKYGTLRASFDVLTFCRIDIDHRRSLGPSWEGPWVAFD